MDIGARDHDRGDLLVFLASDKIREVLGDQAITAIEKLMGLVLTAMSIEMLLSGVAAYINQFRG